MKFALVLITFLTAICVIHGTTRKSHIKHDSEDDVSVKPVERRIPKPPKNLKVVTSPRPPTQSLIFLYKSHAGKKPLMRKFVPTAIRTTEAPIPITRRSIMKQRHFVIQPSAAKHHKKEDIFISTRRLHNFRPITNKTVISENVPIHTDRRTSRIGKSRIVAVSDAERNYDNLNNLPNDLVFAKSQKIYSIALPKAQNSNLKNSTDIDSNLITENKSVQNVNLKDTREDTKDEKKDLEDVKALSGASSKTQNNVTQQIDFSDEVDKDKKEFIFVTPKAVSKSENENTVKEQNDLTKEAVQQLN